MEAPNSWGSLSKRSGFLGIIEQAFRIPESNTTLVRADRAAEETHAITPEVGELPSPGDTEASSMPKSGSTA